MTRGRHSRPRARGGILATLLALVIAAGAVVVAVTKPAVQTMQWFVVGLASVTALGLLLLARNQRASSRVLARTEDRLHALELRSRDEGEELHRRVLESIAREGELRLALDILTSEISLLRGSLEGIVAPVGAAVASAIADRLPEVHPAVDGAGTFDLPLVQRVLAAQDAARPVAPPVAQPAAQPAAQAQEATAQPPAGALWRPPPRPEPVSTDTAVRGWVVREIQVDDVPGTSSLTMRILDLTTPDAPEAPEAADPEADPAPASSGWESFARPA
jgi:hypothetical protein